MLERVNFRAAGIVVILLLILGIGVSTNIVVKRNSEKADRIPTTIPAPSAVILPRLDPMIPGMGSSVPVTVPAQVSAGRSASTATPATTASAQRPTTPTTSSASSAGTAPPTTGRTPTPSSTVPPTTSPPTTSPCFVNVLGVRICG